MKTIEELLSEFGEAWRCAGYHEACGCDMLSDACIADATEARNALLAAIRDTSLDRLAAEHGPTDITKIIGSMPDMDWEIK